MTLAIIGARSGSKGIKGKNLALLDDKPLIYYTIKAAKESKNIDEVLVSSDGDEILAYAKSEGVKTLKRPLELALDESKSEDFIIHALKEFKDFKNFILLQPTSPLRTATHIDEAFEIYKTQKANALISVNRIDNKILKAFILDENENLKGICNNEFPFMPRQKLPQTFMGNGAIYIANIKAFLLRPSFLQENTSYYEMNKQDSLDIDNYDDLARADELIRRLF